MSEISRSPIILVIDDDQHLLTLMGHVLQKHNYQPLLADSAEQTWARLDGLPADAPLGLVLLDLMLPGVNGLELYHALRQRPQTANLPIVVLSAINDIDKRVELLSEGVDDYLVKPCPLHELIARITMHLKLAEVRRAHLVAEARLLSHEKYLHAINTIGHEASQYLDLEAMLMTVCTAVCTQFGCATAGFYLQNPENEQALELHLATSTPHHLPPPASLLKRAGESHTLKTENQHGVIPVLRGPVLLGLLHITEQLPDGLKSSQDKLAALQVLAGQLATTITNAYLFQDIHQHNLQLQTIANENRRLLVAEQRQRQQAEQLHRMAQIISSSLDLHAVLSTALNTIHSMIDVEDGSIVLVDEAKQQLYFAATLTEQPSTQGLFLELGQGVVGMVIQQGEGVIVNDVQSNNQFWPVVDQMTGVTTRSLLCVPLTAHGRIIGALELINKLAGDFNEVDLALASSAAGSIAIAVDNARLYEAQEQATQQLLHTEKMAAAGRLAASMAHEINNPLQAVHSCLQLLIQFELSPAKKQEYLHMAGEEVERLIAITNRILDFSRPSTGHYERVNLQRIINQVMHLAQKYIAHQKVKVQQTLAADAAQVWAIPDQIAQVFLNIILNGLDAMPTGGMLEIHTSLEGEWIKTMIRDNGLGMSQEVQKHLFEPFFSTKPNQAGLGLTISYGIIERHGGRILITSEEGQGTAVSVLLPRPLEEDRGDRDGR